MARLENAVSSLVEMFMQYADDDGNITMDDFKTMLDKEIENEDIKAEVSEEDLEKVLGKLDRDKDGKISIREFTHGVGFLVRCLYRVTGKCKK